MKLDCGEFVRVLVLTLGRSLLFFSFFSVLFLSCVYLLFFFFCLSFSLFYRLLSFFLYFFVPFLLSVSLFLLFCSRSFLFSSFFCLFCFSLFLLRPFSFLISRFLFNSRTAIAGAIFGLLLVFLSSRFLLRPYDVTTTSNLLFVHSFMQFHLKCVRDVILRS